MKVTVIEGSRERQAFCNHVAGWKFMITTGPRCYGIVSRREYSSVDSAYRAGAGMLKKLQSKNE